MSNYVANKTFKVKGGRRYTEGDVITAEEWNNLGEDQGNFEETNITDVGQTQEQADKAQKEFEERQKEADEQRENYINRKAGKE